MGYTVHGVAKSQTRLSDFTLALLSTRIPSNPKELGPPINY